MPMRNKLLIISPLEDERAAIKEILSPDKWTALEAANSGEALSVVKSEGEGVTAVIFAVAADEIDFFTFAKDAARYAASAKIPAMVIADKDSVELKLMAFDFGICDVMIKPIAADILRQRIKNITDASRSREALGNIIRLQKREFHRYKQPILDGLRSMMEYNNLESGRHIKRMQLFSQTLLEEVVRRYPEYGIDDNHILLIAEAASLHDIGKSAVPETILNKPGPLTAQEFDIMKTHAQQGYEILENLNKNAENCDRLFMRYAMDICLYHHERWDGRGYPKGLTGDTIPIHAQTVGLVDCYDALTNDRIYRKAISHGDACTMIIDGKCGAFSPRLLACFKNVKNTFLELSEAYSDNPSAASTAEPPVYGLRPAVKREMAQEAKLFDDRGCDNGAASNFIGVNRYLDDANLTLIYTGCGFFDLFKYTKEEIASRFHNHYLEMIYPPDRQRLLSSLKKYVAADSPFELVYRVMAKGGTLVWVLDKTVSLVDGDGVRYYSSLLIDITKIKEREEILLRSLERYKIIIDQSNDIIFEWDIMSDEFFISPNWYKKYDYQPAGSGVKIKENPRVHPDDVQAVRRILDAMSTGTAYMEEELRIADNLGNYHWGRVRATALFDEMGNPFRVIGVIMDIDRDRRQTYELRIKAERDSLTKLYNKNTGREQVERHLQTMVPGDMGAMFIIDVDNFKHINDSYGHMFGDAVLSKLAENISSIFRSSDVVSRIGGDEFMVFMPHIPNAATAYSHAEQILNAFGGILHENMYSHNLSCSIGVAIATSEENDFQSLFSHADQALYQAKRCGKNNYVAYGERTEAVPQMEDSGASSRTSGSSIESENQLGVNPSEMLRLTFDTLRERGGFDSALNLILNIIGKMFNVSRAYIFESTEDGLYVNNTYEWCNDGIEPQITLLVNIPILDFGGDYRKNFNEEGIFYCPNLEDCSEELQELLGAQGILSTLQVSITEEGKFKGFVGFDDCVIHRLWTQDQINALVFIARLISEIICERRGSGQ